MNIPLKDVFVLIILPLLIFFVLFIGLVVVFIVLMIQYKKYKFLEKYKDEEWLPVVNEKGNVVGKSPRSICHNGSKILHPVVHIHIVNKERKLLLQKRSLTKDIQPGKWDTAIGGHISFGESLEVAIERESKEELGINIDFSKLIPFNKYIFESDIEKEFVFSFIYLYDGEIDFQKDEIDEVSFFNSDEILRLIDMDLVTQNFIKEFSYLRNSKFYSYFA